DVRTLTMFCTALRRAVYEAVGPLDERFGPGMFEDDDYSLRVREAGYRVVVADDAYVHHFGQATIADPAVVDDFGALFHANRLRFEDKWQTRWTPPARATNGDYAALIERIRSVVAE